MKRLNTRFIRRYKRGVQINSPDADVRMQTLLAERDRLHSLLESLQTRLIATDALAALGQLSAGIAHEIRNPINFVNNFAEALVEMSAELHEEIEKITGSDEAGRKNVSILLQDIVTSARKIREHGGRVESIVRSMLLQARGQQGVMEQVQINEFLDQYVTLAFHGMRAQVPDFSVRIERVYDPAAGAVPLIRQGMARVFVNLLNNAFQAVEEKKKNSGEAYEPVVRVSTQCTRDGCTICIEDNGQGVPPHLREKIFEPFFTTKDANSGTGLGLPLSYAIIVGEHKGTLTCSESRFGGAAFLIGLPA